MWTTRGAPAERAGGEGSYSGPVLRYRHYRADARVTAAIGLDPAEEVPDLDALAAAVRRPERPLFLGRKCCPPARPLFERLVEAPSLAAALAAAPPPGGGNGAGPIETEDDPAEPPGRRVVEVADRRDWRLGFHTGLGRRRELHPPPREQAP
jgi:CRISPR system Cascade subunit CasD